MGLFDLFKSAEERKQQEQINQLRKQVFPGGKQQQEKEVQEVRYKTPYAVMANAPKNGDLETLLPDLDSNQDKRIQSPLSYH